jgi:hypothetical protein
VRDPLVGPADQLVPEGDRHPDVDGGEAVRQAGLATAPQVDHRDGEQHDVDDRDGDEQDRTEPAGLQHVSREQPQPEQHPESDLTRDDRDNHDSSLFRTVVLLRL